ncbi:MULTISPECIES: S8 family serine peptidase [unclassified Colwellia]|uniref:S8 family serine peptidase n=1 Tax=unclassified Colwellia TaxID=196834 RepID=UPI0015F4C8EE|nr:MULTISPECIES: S8 family serine peptidase [unclassified Colwellia]MBA6353517.1 S8 family serine peptidase [Colwellia sp. BRX9-1]MBA6357078.1 S8 family serine peptidase [Colwellia sp. BRX8-3]MBA6361055.1 S8 family serine peptidase [Colwellia sp. BRX8-6]MBA6369041.1 S8 family serine peptidase [Colwellia sp. BRX8-5]MBA6375367.1 S8 family serine peptidase [Colwellia sp. BRX8-2]
MKTLPLTAIFISILSTSLPAQQLTSGDVLGNITLVDRNLDDISQQIKVPRKLAPFALSRLPNVDKLTTEPLTALPDSLSIETVTGKNLWFDVEVEQGWRAVKGQWILLADDLNKARLIGQGAVIINESRYSGLGMTLLRFNVPQALDSKKALINILSAKASLSLARNHIYQTQSQARQLTDKKVVGEKLKTKSLFNACQLKVKVGLVDSAIDTNHDAFKQASITAKSFLPAELDASVQHGTVIASLLVGKTEQLVPLLPQGQIYSAEVFYQQSDYVQGATLSAMIAGINWLIEQEVKVINMSLAGPDNKILQAVLTSAMAKGALIIAAAGNEGPAAPPMFPAAYKDVIAVSAIDQFQQPYRWSNRGDYVDYSALGVNVLTAQSGQRVGRESGTSIAAPYVTAALACLIAKIGVNRNQLLEKLNESTIDLGPRGKDPIYGVGAIVSR